MSWENEDTFDYWLQGTTCNRIARKEILFENDTHAVYKHCGHSEYIGRWSGTVRCGTYAVLFDKRILGPYGFRNGYMLRWEGRLSLARILADCAAAGVTFP
jgi:hypothetical protein